MSSEDFVYENNNDVNNSNLEQMNNANIDRSIEDGTMTEQMREGLIRLGKINAEKFNAKIAAQTARMKAENAVQQNALYNARINSFKTKRAARILKGKPGLPERIASAKARVQSKKNTIAANIAKAKGLLEIRQGNINIPPLNMPINVAENEVNMYLTSHQTEVERLKRQALNQYAQTLLGALRTNTNESAKNMIRQIFDIPKQARPAYLLVAKLDDLYGKLTRDLAIAEDTMKRGEIAPKKYEADRLRREVRAVMDKQSANPSYRFPPALMNRVEAALRDQNVGTLLAPTRPVANRLSEAFNAYDAAKQVRYTSLLEQMTPMLNNLGARQKILLLAALDDILEIVKGQPEPRTAEEQAIVAEELATLIQLKTNVEEAIAKNTAIALLDKAKIFKFISDYMIENKSNSLYSQLKKNQNTFNLNIDQSSMVPINIAPQNQGHVLGGPNTGASISVASQRRKTRRNRSNKKN